MPEVPRALREVEAGAQVLVTLSPHASTLDRLPDAAFRNLLVIQTNALPGETERAVRERGLDPDRVGVIPVTGSTVRYDGPLWVADRVSPGDLTGLSIAFSNALRYVREGGWVAFDDLATLSMYADADSLQRFVSSLATAARETGATGTYGVTDGVLDESDVAGLLGSMDARVE
ncbi:hypothetical protein MBEHAL_1735 [Halarchaeum acidiphilum MH1-52-1]|uniref:KaiC-like domain-containing protein n=1 Tax=Halarchaeum acidiphilum MH1-52-1 TaxID=1261545 RepID=U2YVC6_9EURY|nr:hypothetical protein [Halarchaeum acidiphilum]GAD52975.1 hypothetical protein MBEHAL_1735 [Halarchaeum acidiphilum MH1-52-1]